MYDSATEAISRDVPFSDVAAKRAAELDRELDQEISRISGQIDQLSAERERLASIRTTPIIESNRPRPTMVGAKSY